MSFNTGEGPQRHFIDHLTGPNPMVLQVSLQSQFFRKVDIQQMPAATDQGMMSMGPQGELQFSK
jgi:hypothetical protein